MDFNNFLFSATVDVKRNIYDLTVNKYGSQIALVENQGGYDSLQESVVRIYTVGRKKNAEDEAVCVALLFTVKFFLSLFSQSFPRMKRTTKWMYLKIIRYRKMNLLVSRYKK